MAELSVNIWDNPGERPLTSAERIVLQEAGASARIAIDDFPPGHVAFKEPVGEKQMGESIEAAKLACAGAERAYRRRMAERLESN